MGSGPAASCPPAPPAARSAEQVASSKDTTGQFRPLVLPFATLSALQCIPMTVVPRSIVAVAGFLFTLFAASGDLQAQAPPAAPAAAKPDADPPARPDLVTQPYSKAD